MVIKFYQSLRWLQKLYRSNIAYTIQKNYVNGKLLDGSRNNPTEIFIYVSFYARQTLNQVKGGNHVSAKKSCKSVLQYNFIEANFFFAR